MVYRGWEWPPRKKPTDHIYLRKALELESKYSGPILKNPLKRYSGPREFCREIPDMETTSWVHIGTDAAEVIQFYDDAIGRCYAGMALLELMEDSLDSRLVVNLVSDFAFGNDIWFPSCFLRQRDFRGLLKQFTREAKHYVLSENRSNLASFRPRRRRCTNILRREPIERIVDPSVPANHWAREQFVALPSRREPQWGWLSGSHISFVVSINQKNMDTFFNQMVVHDQLRCVVLLTPCEF